MRISYQHRVGKRHASACKTKRTRKSHSTAPSCCRVKMRSRAVRSGRRLRASGTSTRCASSRRPSRSLSFLPGFTRACMQVNRSLAPALVVRGGLRDGRGSCRQKHSAFVRARWSRRTRTLRTADTTGKTSAGAASGLVSGPTPTRWESGLLYNCFHYIIFTRPSCAKMVLRVLCVKKKCSFGIVSRAHYRFRSSSLVF